MFSELFAPVSIGVRTIAKTVRILERNHTDKKIDPNWIVGAQVGFTDGDVRVKGGAGKTDIHSIGGKAYLTWFDENAYVDTVLTFNRHKQ